MANDRLIFEVVPEGKNLKVVQRDVNALAEGVERTDRARKNAGKGQDNYNKREKDSIKVIYRLPNLFLK